MTKQKMANIKDMQKKPLHPAQMRILTNIVTLQRARFKDLRLPGYTTKHITYHINKLLKLGLLRKDADKYYSLTDKGKLFVHDMEIFNKTTGEKVDYAKRSVILRAIKKEGNKYKWLFYKRQKHPFYGYVGFPAGKIPRGESPLQAAMREFLEETGLIMKSWELLKIEHDIVYNKKGEFLFDVYYYAFNIYEFEGQLKQNGQEGTYFWATKDEFEKMRFFPDMLNGKEYIHHWSNAPKLYEQFLQLKEENKWQNKPITWEKINEVKVSYIEWPYEVEEY